MKDAYSTRKSLSHNYMSVVKVNLIPFFGISKRIKAKTKPTNKQLQDQIVKDSYIILSDIYYYASSDASVGLSWFVIAWQLDLQLPVESVPKLLKFEPCSERGVPDATL
jgi:hypothetical protein